MRLSKTCSSIASLQTLLYIPSYTTLIAWRLSCLQIVDLYRREGVPWYWYPSFYTASPRPMLSLFAMMWFAMTMPQPFLQLSGCGILQLLRIDDPRTRRERSLRYHELETYALFFFSRDRGLINSQVVKIAKIIKSIQMCHFRVQAARSRLYRKEI